MSWLGDLFATYYSHKKCMFCAFRVIFRVVLKKKFIFPSHIVTVHCFVHPSLFQTHRSHSQNSIFHHHLFTNLQEKVWVIFFSQSISCFSPWFLGFWVFVWIWKYDVEYGLWIFCWVWCLGFIGFGSMMLIVHALHVCFSFWVLYLVCVVLCILYPW